MQRRPTRAPRPVVLACALALALVCAPAGASAVSTATTLLLDPALPGASGWYDVPPLVSLVPGQSGTLWWWWDTEAPQTAAVSAGESLLVGAAPEGEHIIHGYVVGATAETPGVNRAVKVDSIAPSQPGSFLTVVERNIGVRLTWDASTDDGSGVARYAVYRKAGAPPFAGTDIIRYVTETTDLDVPPVEGDYSYAVSAFDRAGNQSPLTESAVGYRDFVAPVAPTDVTAVQVGSTASIAVAWSHAGTDTTTYQVERSRSGGAFALVQTVAAGSAAWTDPLSGLSQEEQFLSTWQYRVRAAGPGGTSAYGTTSALKLTPAPTSIGIYSSTGRPRRGRYFTLSGVLNAGQVGSRCVIYVRRPWARRWSKLTTRYASAATATGAAWSYRLRRYLSGYYLFQVRFGGDVAHRASTSSTLRIRVR